MTENTNRSSSSHVYLDFNATTPVSGEVVQRLPEALEAWGNPSSIHASGRKPKLLIREARQLIAQSLNCNSLELVFTSGGSESNTTVLRSFLENLRLEKEKSKESGSAAVLRDEFITSAVEHPSVMKTMLMIRSLGFQVHIVPVDCEGHLDLNFYAKVLSAKTALVSIMVANNETGTLFPIKQLTDMAHAVGAKFHTDAVQALGKLRVDLKELGVDYASFSGHKFYALKGCGLLYQKKGAPLNSLILGGGQERHRRGGTENILAIHALRVMFENISAVTENSMRIEKMRDSLESQILQRIQNIKVTAAQGPRLTNTSSLIIAGADGETLLMSLDLQGFAVSTGAACSSGNPEPSPVLLAMGLSRSEAQNSLRISLGWSTSQEQVEAFVSALVAIVARLRSFETSDDTNFEREDLDVSNH